ncbi:MAG: penicillin acylase family protein [Fuerstiella sp.]
MNKPVLSSLIVSMLSGWVVSSVADEQRPAAVRIDRDEWGVAHIHGRTHADAFFGMGYAQAEDYFWQLEDTCIRSLGRYSEVVGEDGIRSDILNRSFEIVRRSREDFSKLPQNHQEMASAYAAGINRYLETHPDEKPRLINHFEPWFAVAMDRHMILDFIYRQSHVGKPRNRRSDEVAGRSDRIDAMAKYRQYSDGDAHLDPVPGVRTASPALAGDFINSWDVPEKPATGFDDAVRAAIGSNAWAISGSKTESGATMLFVNPHQPWYGMGQFYEAHIRSDEGLHFTGASFFGNPFPTIGHNEHLGWTYTVNEPDIADVWRITFDLPTDPLKYRYDGGYRTATQWKEILKVKRGGELIDQTVTFRKTHHGPIVRRENANTFLAVQVAGLSNVNRMNQAWGMVLARNFREWRAAVSYCAIPMFNVVYADDADNIFYAYNGTIPRRDPKFDWQRPVDGGDPETEWQGFHSFDELPQVLNPKSGYVQSCNSTPFTTTDIDSDNPRPQDFPRYMIEDANVDMRRSKMSRLILKNATDVTFEQWQDLSYDTRMYWAMTEIPKLAADYERLKTTRQQLASEIAPYWAHLQDWDFRSTIDSTQTTLTVAWYEQLYGFGYPAETLKEKYSADRLTWFAALKAAADKLNGLHGTWKHPWGQAHRLQRVANQPDVQHAGVGLNPFFENLPCPGAPGPLGIIFTIYSSPEIPVVRPQRFAVVGASYMAIVEFGERIRTNSVMPFGSSGRRNSSHFFDQAKLYSAMKLKPAWFYKHQVEEHSKRLVLLNR